jgi:hypothetical protein
MTNREKEKLFTQTIKNLSKVQKWKFKSYFIFKQLDNLFFESNFYINPKTNNIYGYLAYKPYSVDDTFWEFSDMPENSKMPLSFRADAAFRVSSFDIYKYDITIENTKKPEKEIQSLLKIIDGKVKSIIKENITVEDFLNTLEKDNNNPVGIITCLMELEQYEKVLSKIEIYKKNDIHSGYSFGSTDFFDFVENICNKKLNIGNSVFMKIGNQINKIFKN